MVPKKKPVAYRIVVDLRSVNERVKITAGMLPNLEMQALMAAERCMYFASLDTLSGFAMLRTRKEDPKNFCFSAPFGCFRLLGAPMGFVNIPSVCQLLEVMRNILGSCIKWGPQIEREEMHFD